MKIELNNIYHGDCLEVMPSIPDKSIDMILCDLPYGVTACKWDSIIDINKLWEQYKRIIKNNGAIVLTGTQPFTSMLVLSNIKMFRYEWIWNKKIGIGFQIAKFRPLQQHEHILIFSKSSPNYFPIKRLHKTTYKTQYQRKSEVCVIKHDNYDSVKIREYNNYYPKSILNFSNADHSNVLHPTQKPVVLFEYLIKTYTKENETVLDNCIGSGTTAIACINTGRNYIGIEKDDHYFKVTNDRIMNHKRLLQQKKKFEVYK